VLKENFEQWIIDILPPESKVLRWRRIALFLKTILIKVPKAMVEKFVGEARCREMGIHPSNVNAMACDTSLRKFVFIK
jgi:hypothetical protein